VAAEPEQEFADESSGLANLRDLARKLLQVPKDEVEALRRQRQDEQPKD
jgi:hypothetical protein